MVMHEEDRTRLAQTNSILQRIERCYNTYYNLTDTKGLYDNRSYDFYSKPLHYNGCIISMVRTSDVDGFVTIDVTDTSENYKTYSVNAYNIDHSPSKYLKILKKLEGLSSYVDSLVNETECENTYKELDALKI
jgi:hypothetical protein